MRNGMGEFLTRHIGNVNIIDSNVNDGHARRLDRKLQYGEGREGFGIPVLIIPDLTWAVFDVVHAFPIP